MSDWRDRGACVGEDPELWFGFTDGDEAEARSICRRECWVQQECGAWALAQPKSLEGIWAGLDQTERNALRRKVA